MPRGEAAGSPHSFRCWRCRRRHANDEYHAGVGAERTRSRGYSGNVELTGRRRPKHRTRAKGLRHGWEELEYRCLTCRYVGWSSHHQLLSKAGVTC